MVTGLILMTHATWSSLSSKNSSFTAGVQAPFDPTGVTAIRRSSVSDGVRPTFGYTASEEANHIPGAVIHETGKYPGTRVWAVQWQLVDAQILPAEKWQADADNQLKLKDTSELAPKIAVVEIRADSYAENAAQEDENVSGLDDEYWESFLDASEKFE
jgi:hypothetical protein